jgi:hypothetical protein
LSVREWIGPIAQAGSSFHALTLLAEWGRRLLLSTGPKSFQDVHPIAEATRSSLPRRMIMATTPQEEQPGFETDVNELPVSNQGPDDTLEEKPSEDEESSELEKAQEEAAEERKEGGYQ